MKGKTWLKKFALTDALAYFSKAKITAEKVLKYLPSLIN
jgi:hypothetical protein